MYGMGRALPKDDEQAAAWYRKAGEQGHLGAQCGLEQMYAEGRGVPNDNEQAAAWYRKAAEQGNPIAQRELGGMYLEKDNAKALGWIRRAAEQGDALSQVVLAQMFEKGWGTPQDDEQAAAWYRKAAEQKDFPAATAHAKEALLRICAPEQGKKEVAEANKTQFSYFDGINQVYVDPWPLHREIFRQTGGQPNVLRNTIFTMKPDTID